MLGTRAVKAVAVLVDGYLSHNRQLGIDLTRRQQRLVQLLKITKGFEDDEVDPLFVEGLNLFPKSGARF